MIETPLPVNQESELASIRIPLSFVSDYLLKDFLTPNKTIVYEDLDYHSETEIRAAIDSSEDKLQCHAHVLQFLSILFKKVSFHDKGLFPERLHPDDIRALMQVVIHLRDPTAREIPSISTLADMAKMSQTKFKHSFKQLFGLPPISYHYKIKMEYARDALLRKKKSPSELSHQLGYAHPSNFTAAYKKHFGELPSLT